MIDDKKEMKYKIIILRLQNSTSLIYLSLFHEYLYTPPTLCENIQKKRNGATSKKYNWNYTFINISIFPSRIKGLSVLSSSY